VVDVAGAVRHPGLYRLRSGSRIDDAIAAAGGSKAGAQLASVNLAAPVADGEQVVVPGRGAGGAAAAASPPTAGSSPSAPLDLNSATLEELENLPGIGPVTAQKILDYRQQHGAFHSIDELQGVPGIGPAHMAQLKGLVIP
jgi:competence protein ComEA